MNKLIASVLCSFAVTCSLEAGPRLGYMLDISRDKVPTMETLRRVVDVIAPLGYRELQLYTEHVFAYKGHEEVWGEASPLTPDEVRALDAYAAAKGVDLVANQNSYGHLTKWLEKPSYLHLAETPHGGAYTRWGSYLDHPSDLCVTDPESLKLVESWYDELLPCFRTKKINVGGDETFDLTAPNARSAEYVKKVGRERAYLEFLGKICKAAEDRGAEPMFWGDFFYDHPELIATEVPSGAVPLDWGYSDKHDFDKMGAAYAAAGVRFRFCPGTSSWNSLSGRFGMARRNLSRAVAAARKHSPEALLLADWGDGGHPQPFIVSLPALVYLAMKTGAIEGDEGDLAAALDRVMKTRGAGELLLEYSVLDEKCGVTEGNATPLVDILKFGRDSRKFAKVGEGGVRAVLDAAAALSVRVKTGRGDLFTAETPEWVKDGFEVFNLLYRALELRVFGEPEKIALEIVPEYRRLWLKYNRIGGLDLSVREVFR